MDLKSILRKRNEKSALVIGNGINRYNSANGKNSWDKMLLSLWNNHGRHESSLPADISLTEFYDVIELENYTPTKKLQKEFCDLMESWKPEEHHRNIVTWAKDKSVPILTTNFENTLSDCVASKLFHNNSQKFTRYYPWRSYYSTSEVTNVSEEFAIWHINGMQQYPDSIRLGLTHYMGSVEKARGYLHKGKGDRLFSGRVHDSWKAKDSWLEIIFKNDLIFFGLALDTTEVFLRWLLLERARYFKKFPEYSRTGYYIYSGEDISSGKSLFLKSVGINCVKVKCISSDPI